MKLFLGNVLLLSVFLIVCPLAMSAFHRVPNRYGFPIAMLFFLAAAYVLNDFGGRSRVEFSGENFSLYEFYTGGIRHTFQHVGWVLVVNFLFAAGFGAILAQAKGFGPIPMAMWLMSALTVSVIVGVYQKGAAQVAELMTPQLIIGLVAAVVSCACLQWHTMR